MLKMWLPQKTGCDLQKEKEVTSDLETWQNYFGTIVCYIHYNDNLLFHFTYFRQNVINVLFSWLLELLII